jgi:hypothetical protein
VERSIQHNPAGSAGQVELRGWEKITWAPFPPRAPCAPLVAAWDWAYGCGSRGRLPSFVHARDGAAARLSLCSWRSWIAGVRSAGCSHEFVVMPKPSLFFWHYSSTTLDVECLRRHMPYGLASRRQESMDPHQQRGTGTKIFSGCQPEWVLSGPWVGGPAPPRDVDRRRLLQWFAARLQGAVPGYVQPRHVGLVEQDRGQGWLWTCTHAWMG